MKYIFLIQRKRFCKLNKKTFFSFFYLFSALLFANSLDDVEKDVQCFLNYGYRPISYSIDRCINSQGKFQDFGLSTVAAINGKGFFCLKKDDNEIILTRNGFFIWDKDGFLINHDGYRVLHSSSNIEGKDYKYITSEDIRNRNKKTKMMPIDEKYKKDVESTPYLIGYPLKNVQKLDGEYITGSEIVKVYSHVIYGARELNPMQFKELYILCSNTFDEYKGAEFIEQKKRIVSKFEVVISYLLNTNFCTTEELKGELKNMVETLKMKIN